MYFINVVYIFLRAVPGMPHVTDHFPGCHLAADLKISLIWVILAEMCVIIVSFFIVAADTNAPAAVLIPAKCLHGAALDCDDGSTNKNIK